VKESERKDRMGEKEIVRGKEREGVRDVRRRKAAAS
jgi:hypothetical protein